MFRPSIIASNTPTAYGSPASAYKPSHGGRVAAPLNVVASGSGKPADWPEHKTVAGRNESISHGMVLSPMGISYGDGQ